MATQVYGEYIPSKQGSQLLGRFTTYYNQPVGSTIGIGTNFTGSVSLGTFTPTANQEPIMVPNNAVTTNLLITAWGAAPTAGSLTFTLNGVTTASQSFSTFTLTTVNTLTFAVNLTAGGRYPLTIAATGYSQPAAGGLHIQLWGYLT